MEKDGEWIWTNKWEISSRPHPSASTLLLCPDEILCLQQKDHPNSHQLCWWQFSDLPTWNLKQEDYQCTHMRQESEEEREVKNKHIICITFYCQVPISDTRYGLTTFFTTQSIFVCCLFCSFVWLLPATAAVWNSLPSEVILHDLGPCWFCLYCVAVVSIDQGSWERKYPEAPKQIPCVPHIDLFVPSV